jgi:hypothetical protein
MHRALDFALEVWVERGLAQRGRSFTEVREVAASSVGDAAISRTSVLLATGTSA